MSFAHKIRVAVVRGGPSSEYEASLKTGEAVLKNLPQKYEGVDVFISREGVWHVGGFEKKPGDALKHVDVVFSALHGRYGADGGIQALLERLRVPFVGTRSFESAVAANKHLVHKALASLKGSVKSVTHKLFRRGDVEARGTEGVFREIVLPAVVRPASIAPLGAETVVKTFFDLGPAIDRALEHADAIIVEELIEGDRVSCVLVEGFRGEGLYVFPIEHHDLAAKNALQEAARAVHRALGLRHYSRIDFVLHPRRGAFFAAASVSPSLEPAALLPRSIDSVGSSLPEYLDHVISLALSRTS